jgi:hypothetical protein
MADKFRLKTSMQFSGVFNIPQICDMEKTALIPLRKKGIFFCPKNPTALAGFEPAILGTRGQHTNH